MQKAAAAAAPWPVRGRCEYLRRVWAALRTSGRRAVGAPKFTEPACLLASVLLASSRLYACLAAPGPWRTSTGPGQPRTTSRKGVAQHCTPRAAENRKARRSCLPGLSPHRARWGRGAHLPGHRSIQNRAEPVPATVDAASLRN